MSSLVEDLQALDTQLSRGWCRGRMQNGDKHCLVGAMRVVAEDHDYMRVAFTGLGNPRFQAMSHALYSQLPEGYQTTHLGGLWIWNDDQPNVEAVRKLVAEAIMAAEEI